MQAVQWPHAGRCNCPCIVGCGTGCSGQASRRRARPSHSRVPGQPGSAASRLGEGWQGWGCAGKRRTRKSSASWVPQPSLVEASHGERGLSCRRWRLITPFPCWLLAISLAAGGQAGSHPERSVLGAVGKGSRPPSPRSQPRAVYFYMGCFLSGLKPSCTAARAGPGPPRLISLP